MTIMVGILFNRKNLLIALCLGSASSWGHVDRFSCRLSVVKDGEKLVAVTAAVNVVRTPHSSPLVRPPPDPTVSYEEGHSSVRLEGGKEYFLLNVSYDIALQTRAGEDARAAQLVCSSLGWWVEGQSLGLDHKICVTGEPWDSEGILDRRWHAISVGRDGAPILDISLIEPLSIQFTSPIGHHYEIKAECKPASGSRPFSPETSLGSGRDRVMHVAPVTAP